MCPMITLDWMESSMAAGRGQLSSYKAEVRIFVRCPAQRTNIRTGASFSAQQDTCLLDFTRLSVLLFPLLLPSVFQPQTQKPSPVLTALKTEMTRRIRNFE